MAAYTFEAHPAGEAFPEGTRVVVWTLTSEDPDGAPYRAPHRSDKSVQISGTIGTAVAALQGSNEVAATPGSWVNLNDPSSTAISFGSGLPKLKHVQENTYQVRPSLTTPGSGATVVVRLLVTTVARR